MLLCSILLEKQGTQQFLLFRNVKTQIRKVCFGGGTQCRFLQRGFPNSDCSLERMKVSAAGERKKKEKKRRRVINFSFFLFNAWWQRLAFCYLGTLTQAHAFTGGAWRLSARQIFNENLSPLQLWFVERCACCCQAAACMPRPPPCRRAVPFASLPAASVLPGREWARFVQSPSLVRQGELVSYFMPIEINH